MSEPQGLRPLDRRPLAAALLLLACAAAYGYILLVAIGLELAWPAPPVLSRLIGDQELRYWVWDQLVQTLTVLMVCLFFALLLLRLFTRRLLRAALIVVTPAALWMVLDYFTFSGRLPDVPAPVKLIYALDVAKMVLVLPLLVLLLGRGRGQAAAGAG